MIYRKSSSGFDRVYPEDTPICICHLLAESENGGACMPMDAIRLGPSKPLVLYVKVWDSLTAKLARPDTSPLRHAPLGLHAHTNFVTCNWQLAGTEDHVG